MALAGGMAPVEGSAQPGKASPAHGGAQLQRGLHHKLTSLLTARYSKAWLTQNSCGLLINTVPPNYSMENRFWTNKNKCLKLKFSLMVQKALQNSTEPWGSLSLGHQSPW